MKKKVFASLVMISMFLTTLALNFASAPVDIKEPKCEVVLSSHVVMRPTDPVEKEILDHWIYVTNPSKEMERDGTDVHHSISVNWINLSHTWPTGGPSYMQVYPNGTVVLDGVVFYDPEWGNRIRTVVYPMEKALVWYSGWEIRSTTPPGIWNFIFTANIEYEEQTLELVETFQVVIQ